MGRVRLLPSREGGATSGEGTTDVLRPMNRMPVSISGVRFLRCVFGGAAGDRSGTMIIEFALIAPVLIAMMMVVIEFGLMYTAQGILDGAALRASRVGSTGYTPTGETREAYIRRYIGEQAFGLLKPDKIVIAAKAYGDFGSIGKSGSGTTGFGSSGQVVDYQLTYPWTGITPVIGQMVTSRKITLSAHMAVRNEAW